MKRWLSLLLALTMLLAMASTASAAEITDLNTYETTNQEMQHFNIFYSQSKTELDVLSNCIDGLLTNDSHGNLVANSAKEWYSEDGGKTWSDMSPIEQNYGDRWIRGYHIGVEHHPTESGTSPCYHQYQYKLKDAAATAIEVRATDSFGHVYTQDTFTADNDFTEAEKY